MPRQPADIPDAWLRLLLCEDLGPRVAGQALKHFGSAEDAVAASASEWAGVCQAARHRGAAVAAALRATSPASERARMKHAGLSMVLLGDPDYPPLLSEIDSPPLGLWVRGSLEATGPAPAAVVGARRATAYGLAQAARFAGALAEQGVPVVSGGARGIDAEAHRAALRAGGHTVAVLGCGLGTGPYPPEHGPLYQAIVEGGGVLLSEFPTDWPVLAANFPRRNRVIAGLSVGVLVVEAAVNSGALITARFCGEGKSAGRKAWAVPGPVDSPRSEGCNRAIRDNLAECVLEPAHVLESLQTEGLYTVAGTRITARERNACATVPPALAQHRPAIEALLTADPAADAEAIMHATGLPPHLAQAARTLWGGG